MAIIINLDVMLARRKMRLTELSDHVGITMANLSNLKTGKARAIRFTTLEAICAALDCQPGDLIEFRPNTDPAAPPDTAAPAQLPATHQSEQGAQRSGLASGDRLAPRIQQTDPPAERTQFGM